MLATFGHTTTAGTGPGLSALELQGVSVKRHQARSIAVCGIAIAMLVSVTVVADGPAAANNRNNRPAAPTELGDYSIGHTTVQVTDPSRNLDGSTPATSAGRYLHMDIWYPTDVANAEHTTYTWNNPLYNENPGGAVWPGLPDLAPLPAQGAESLNPVLEGAPLAPGDFPLLVGSHGNLVTSSKNMPDTMEALASHGFVVMSVEHTGNSDAWYQADWLGRRLGLPIGPNPSIAAEGTILQRTKDVSFVIDSALDGTVDADSGIDFSDRIDDDEIGVLGFSLGGQTSLATVAGIGAEGQPADDRVTAALMVGGTQQGLSWMSGAPFMDSVRQMASFWLWRAVGGTLMFLSHLVFAYNVWRMRPLPRSAEAPEAAAKTGLLPSAEGAA